MKKLDKFREPINVFPSNLTSTEQDIFALVLCELSKTVGFNKKAEKNGEDLKTLPIQFEFTEAEIMDLFGCTKKNIYQTLEPAADSLTNRRVSYRDGRSFDYFYPIARAKYSVGGKFEIEILKSVSEMLSQNISSGFSEIDFRLFVRLSGGYGRRVLKSLSQWKNQNNKEIKFSIQEYRDYLGVPEEKYKAFENFRRRCIEPVFKDIIETSQGVWTATDQDGKGYELIKEGRAYSHIVFKMKYNDPKKIKKNKGPANHGSKDKSKEAMLITLYEKVIENGFATGEDIENYIKAAEIEGYKIPDEIKKVIYTESAFDGEDLSSAFGE